MYILTYVCFHVKVIILGVESRRIADNNKASFKYFEKMFFVNRVKTK